MYDYPRDICDNKQDVTPETYINVVDPNGPGFEYYPQATVVGSSVDVDTSCCGNCMRFGQVMHSSDITQTQSIVRVYNDGNLHSYMAVLSNTDEHGVNQIMLNFVGSNLEQETTNINCTMGITIFSYFNDGNWFPFVYFQGKGGL